MFSFNFHECCLVFVFWCICGVTSYNIQRSDSFEHESPFNYEMIFTDSDSKNLLETLDHNRGGYHGYGPTDRPQKDDDDNTTPLDSWSVVWYIASFGGLIAFFLVVSCSEWCCRRAARNNSTNNRTIPQAATTSTTQIPDAPPPSYDEFAPPSYESICLGRSENGEKNEYDIYVVPVHMVGTIVEEDAPPSYLNVHSDSDLRPTAPIYGPSPNDSQVT